MASRTGTDESWSKSERTATPASEWSYMMPRSVLPMNHELHSLLYDRDDWLIRP
jgi:hypothetical protein